MLGAAGRQLEDGRRLLEETSQVGAGVLGDLAHQRETIQRTRSRLKDLEGDLGLSGSLAGGMLWRARQHRLVLGLVLAAVSLAVIYGLYRLAAG